jgi:hypothetical protein
VYQGTSFRADKGKLKMSLHLSKHQDMRRILDVLDIPVLNSAPRHEDSREKGGTAPRILDLSTTRGRVAVSLISVLTR